MRKHNFGYRLSDDIDGDATSVEFREFEAALGDAALSNAALGDTVVGNNAVETVELAQSDRDQLARDLDAIERATAALRRAQPSLETWAGDPQPAAMSKPRPVWLLVGLLWLSTALVTVGAVAAIAALIG